MQTPKLSGRAWFAVLLPSACVCLLSFFMPRAAAVQLQQPGSEPAGHRAEPAANETGTQNPALSSKAGSEDSRPNQEAGPAEPQPAPPLAAKGKDPRSYAYWVFAPALLAIVFAIATRQVVPALMLGVLLGAYMRFPCLDPTDSLAQMHPVIGGFRLAMEKYVLGVLRDPTKLQIVFFTVTIGFMVGAIGRNGGTAGMVRLVSGRTTSPRRAELTAWLSGIVVFFDDYANAMIIGPTMAPVFDRVKVSRAKLAYIVDSTCAPVASLAIIGTWIGAEIGFINDGLRQLAPENTPAYLAEMRPMTAFIQSIPYRFYAILALFLVFLLAWTGRDFGPMRRSQRRAVAGAGDSPHSHIQSVAPVTSLAADVPPRWWLGFFPVFVLVVVTLAILGIGGMRGVPQEEWASDTRWWARAGVVLKYGDAYLSIFYGAVLAAFTAILLTVFARACSTKAAVEAGLEGMARMFPAIVILVFAWAISQVLQDLKLGEIASEYLRSAQFDAEWLPLAVFLSAAVISFATGTSWATMGILCPVTVMIAAHLTMDMPAELALPLFYSAVGSVLAGAIFGDHCSPISDTTVLSSIASGCPHEEHVWTQMPYALVTAVVSIGTGNLIRDIYGQPWWVGLIAGGVILWMIVVLVGRRAQPYGRQDMLQS